MISIPSKKNTIRFILFIFSVLLLSSCGSVENAASKNAVQQDTPTAIQSKSTEGLVLPTQTRPDSTATPVFTPTPSLSIGSQKIRETDGMTMMYIPEGEFLMGSTDEQIEMLLKTDYCKKTNCRKSYFAHEMPQHKVYLDAYWIDRTEVTNAEYARCVNAGACKAPGQWTDQSHERWYGNPKFDNYPVTIITYDQASSYCQWAGGRLPTEAEWEKAARGTDGRTFPWGNELDKSRANTCDKWCQAMSGHDPSVDDGYAEIAPVGSYPDGASPYGVMDMAGNVFEYITDWYSVGYYAVSPEKNPQGPLTPVPPDPSREDLLPCRILRGGAWDENNDLAIRTTSRRCGGGTYYCLGFRCAVDAQ